MLLSMWRSDIPKDSINSSFRCRLVSHCDHGSGHAIRECKSWSEPPAPRLQSSLCWHKPWLQAKGPMACCSWSEKQMLVSHLEPSRYCVASWAFTLLCRWREDCRYALKPMKAPSWLPIRICSCWDVSFSRLQGARKAMPVLWWTPPFRSPEVCWGKSLQN